MSFESRSIVDETVANVNDTTFDMLERALEEFQGNINRNISYYNEPDEILTNRSMTVFQASPNGRTALVSLSGKGGPSDQIYYFYQTGRVSPLYDGQVIKAPVGMVFKVVGVHSYNTNYGISTVPVITIMDRKDTRIPR